MKQIISNKGFSLVELTVVVAIIGILSIVAIPGYQTYQARARQKEGFGLLNTYFLAAQATHAEFNVFPGDFVQTGFAPVGALGYRLRAENGTLINLAAGINDDFCIITLSACNCGGACPTFKTWTEKNGSIGTAIGATSVTLNACGPVAARHVSDHTFSIRVGGVVNLKATTRDQYAMDHNKQLAMCSDGLK